MKTTFKFGAGSACVGAIVALISYLLGFQNDPDKFIIGSILGLTAGIAITVVFMVKGTRAVRNESDLIDGFSYGKAWKACVQVGLFGTLLAGIFNFIFFTYINPDFADAAIGWTTNLMENSGAPRDKIDEQVATMKADSTPMKGTLNGIIGGVIFSIILALICAGFLKKEPDDSFDTMPPPIDEA